MSNKNKEWSKKVRASSEAADLLRLVAGNHGISRVRPNTTDASAGVHVTLIGDGSTADRQMIQALAGQNIAIIFATEEEPMKKPEQKSAKSPGPWARFLGIFGLVPGKRSSA